MEIKSFEEELEFLKKKDIELNRKIESLT